MQRTRIQRASHHQSPVRAADAGRYAATDMIVRCDSCGWGNVFEQPYAYHAGHADQGFLYNDEGNLTLVWSSFDPSYEAVVGQKHPWTLTPDERSALESALLPAPSGGRWRFSNPARCKQCGEAISEPITRTIYYLVHEGSVITDADTSNRAGLKPCIVGAA